jgi:hypothetical protein
LFAAKLFIWDEISSQHTRDFAAAYSAMRGFEGKILIVIGDFHQIAPVIPRGTKDQIIAASIYCSQYLQQFQKIFFRTNLRLIGTSPVQQQYAEMLLEIGNGTHFQNNLDCHNTSVCTIDPQIDEGQSGVTRIALTTIKTYIEQNQAINWLHPDGFDPHSMSSACILAGII